MAWSDTRALISADLRRRGRIRPANVMVNPALRFTVLLRLGAWLRTQPALKPLEILVRLWLLRARHRFGFDIPCETSIGPGLLLTTHPGGITVNKFATLGANCDLSQQVTIGRASGGRTPGVPTIGNRVFIGAGAKVIGGITIGDDVAIGANSVVTSDIPAGSVAAGIPARVISERGAGAYIRNVVEA